MGHSRGHRFNLGTGQPASVRQVMKAVEAAMGRPVPHSEAPRREGDPMSLYASVDLAREKLGWQPQNLDIVDIVRSAVAWDAKYAADLAKTG